MIDLSHWDDLPNGAYRKYAEAGNFLWMLKATESTDFKDPAFRKHYQNLKKECEGLPIEIGAYHVISLESQPIPGPDVDAEINNYLSVVKGLDIKYHAIDMEALPNLIHLSLVLQAMADETRTTPILYGSLDIMNQIASDGWFGLEMTRACPLWIARYSNQKPEGFDRLWAWQYTDSYSIESLPKVDRSILIDAKQWRSF